MVIDRIAYSARATRRPAPLGGDARSDQRHSLSQPHRLLLANAAARPAALGHGALLLPAVSTRRRLADHSRPPPRAGPRRCRQAEDAFRRHHRFAIGEDGGKRGSRGYDAGKKIGGRKRHIVVDTLGLIIAIVVHAASLQDRDGAKLVLAKLNEKRKGRRLFPRLERIWADGGYAGQLIDWAKHLGRWTLEIVKRSEDAIGFAVLPKRWIVERTFAWLGKYRRLSKDYETITESSESMIRVAMINLMIHRL